ncbi:unnamed protein product [Penicillium pancosmium]
MSKIFKRGGEKFGKAKQKLKERGESFRRRFERGFEGIGNVRVGTGRGADDSIPPLRFQNSAEILIDKRQNAPRDWDPNDNDIDENDLDAMIQRCNERINDNILPQVWRDKLKDCLEMKAELEALVKSKRLEAVKKALLENGDKYKSIPDIDKIMDSYRSGTYKWDHVTATYWSKGSLIAGPKKFDDKELLRL